MSFEANHAPATLSGEVGQAVVSHLVRAIVQAASEGDRAIFDRLFDVAFRLTHGAAWKSAGETGVAERHTAQTLLSALRAELDAVERSDASAAPR